MAVPWLKRGYGILPRRECWKTEERYLKKTAISCGNMEQCIKLSGMEGLSEGSQTRRKEKWGKRDDEVEIKRSV